MRRDAVNGVEQERLKQALDRLIDAQREALDVIAEQSEPDVGGLEEYEQLLVGGHLEAALEEVRAILEGAQEDVRGIVMRCRRPSPASSTKSIPSNIGRSCGSTNTQEKRNMLWCWSTPLLDALRKYKTV